MYAIAEAAQPITGRGVGYKLFTQKLIPSMNARDMHAVYRLLKEAREEGSIPWEWIVDETRELEKVAMWDDPAAFVRTMGNSYRREFWNRQPTRVEVWSEKGTVRGVLAPTLDKYGVGFRVLHGFSSATTVMDVCRDSDRRPLVVLYCGDLDPSGACMSEVDLPKRFKEYGGDHIVLKRIAITQANSVGLPSFPASDKGPKDGRRGDPVTGGLSAILETRAGNWTRWTRMICGPRSRWQSGSTSSGGSGTAMSRSIKPNRNHCEIF
jgi:hypothetical protein